MRPLRPAGLSAPLLGVQPVNRIAGLRLVPAGETITDLVQNGRRGHICVAHLGSGYDLMDIEVAAVRHGQRAAPVGIRLDPVPTAEEGENPLLVSQVHIHLVGIAIGVEAIRLRSQPVVYDGEVCGAGRKDCR